MGWLLLLIIGMNCWYKSFLRYGTRILPLILWKTPIILRRHSLPRDSTRIIPCSDGYPFWWVSAAQALPLPSAQQDFGNGRGCDYIFVDHDCPACQEQSAVDAKCLSWRTKSIWVFGWSKVKVRLLFHVVNFCFFKLYTFNMCESSSSFV